MNTEQTVHVKELLTTFLFTLDITFKAIINSFTRQLNQEFELLILTI